MATTPTFSREQVEQMPAGPELNALIAEAVFGCDDRIYVRQYADKPWVPAFKPEWHVGREKLLMLCDVMLSDKEGGKWAKVAFAPPFSTDLTYAWKLVDAMNGHHYFELSQFWLTGGSRGGMLGFQSAFRSFQATMRDWAQADTAPLAICRAALLAATSPLS
jgi:hypothetical protein